MAITTSPPPENISNVEIVFKHSPTILSLIQMDCPPRYPYKTRSITNNASGNAMVAAFPAYPQRISFAAIEEEQIIYKLGEEGGEIFLKITVKQIKDD